MSGLLWSSPEGSTDSHGYGMAGLAQVANPDKIHRWID
jgi:hypothetical protein